MPQAAGAFHGRNAATAEARAGRGFPRALRAASRRRTRRRRGARLFPDILKPVTAQLLAQPLAADAQLARGAGFVVAGAGQSFKHQLFFRVMQGSCRSAGGRGGNVRNTGWREGGSRPVVPASGNKSGQRGPRSAGRQGRKSWRLPRRRTPPKPCGTGGK